MLYKHVTFEISITFYENLQVLKKVINVNLDKFYSQDATSHTKSMDR